MIKILCTLGWADTASALDKCNLSTPKVRYRTKILFSYTGDQWQRYCTSDSFYARKQLLLSARLSHRNSVRLSVCPPHRWISQKRCKL